MKTERVSFKVWRKKMERASSYSYIHKNGGKWKNRVRCLKEEEGKHESET